MCANYPAAAFVIMMITTVLLVPSSAAPTHHSDAEIADSWWFNACGHHSILHLQNKKHHNKTDMHTHIFRIVKNQLKLFNDFFNQEIQEIRKMYAVVEPFDKVERKLFDWLPKYRRPTKMIRSKTALKELHSGLQYYVVAVNYLEKLKDRSQATFNWTERNERFVKVFNNIKSLICEVEAGVNATDQTVTERVTPDYPQQKGLQTEFDGITPIYLHDTGVLYKLRDFTKKWHNNLMKRLPANHKRESESEESVDIPDEDDEENSIE